MRYDGCYRIVRAYRKPGAQGQLVCRYLFVRADNEPAPWSSEGARPRPDLTTLAAHAAFVTHSRPPECCPGAEATSSVLSLPAGCCWEKRVLHVSLPAPAQGCRQRLQEIHFSMRTGEAGLLLSGMLSWAPV